MAKLSILALYNYDTSIFSGFSVPEGMDRTAAISKICLDTAGLEVLYPETETMRSAITMWSAIHLPQWTRIWNVLNMEYNPLWNVDATITRTESVDESGSALTESSEGYSRDRTTSGTEGGTIKNTGTEKNTGTVQDQGSKTNTGTVTDAGTSSNTNTRSVVGFNSSSWQDTEKNVDSGTDGNTRTDNLSEATGNTRTDNLTRTDDLTETRNLTTGSTESIDDSTTGTSETTTSKDLDRTESERRTGNIGVTASQDLVMKELDVATVNVYQLIVESFKKEFCICIY